MSRPVGDAAEIAAARHLETLGYRILARNVKSKVGELDIVARDGGVLCFVEVRLRRGGGAEESVTVAKQRRLARAAEHYLQANRMTRAACRFDVVGIAVADGAPRFTVIKDAF